MASNEGLPQLQMRLPSLAALPALVVPGGYALRQATPGDLVALLHCLSAAFPEIEWSEERVRTTLFDDTSVKAVFVVEAPDQTLVATASARLDPTNHPQAGYVHWVGVDPANVGHGLGKLVSLAVLHEFARRGFSQSVLETDDFRLPAIRLYKKLGFAPECTHPSHEARWAALRE
jgi:mycothiol synthase